tara:strand:- start:304 stop:834 length:531 start_codon:yes stop_codon:yes gene_type:complete
MTDIHKRTLGTTAAYPFLPEKFVFSFLKDDSTIEMNVNGASTPVSYKYTAPAGKRVYVYRVNMMMLDASVTASKFGGVASLTTGITVKVKNSADTELLDFLDGQTIQNNTEFGLLAGTDINVGSGADGVNIRWTLASAGGSLILESGDYLEVLVQDNLTGLTSFQAMLQGIVEDNS